MEQIEIDARQKIKARKSIEETDKDVVVYLAGSSRQESAGEAAGRSQSQGLAKALAIVSSPLLSLVVTIA
jgi:succinyl-CoA synthetase alpha subunit